MNTMIQTALSADLKSQEHSFVSSSIHTKTDTSYILETPIRWNTNSVGKKVLNHNTMNNIEFVNSNEISLVVNSYTRSYSEDCCPLVNSVEKRYVSEISFDIKNQIEEPIEEISNEVCYRSILNNTLPPQKQLCFSETSFPSLVHLKSGESINKLSANTKRMLMRKEGWNDFDNCIKSSKNELTSQLHFNSNDLISSKEQIITCTSKFNFTSDSNLSITPESATSSINEMLQESSLMNIENLLQDTGYYSDSDVNASDSIAADCYILSDDDEEEISFGGNVASVGRYRHDTVTEGLKSTVKLTSISQGIQVPERDTPHHCQNATVQTDLDNLFDNIPAKEATSSVCELLSDSNSIQTSEYLKRGEKQARELSNSSPLLISVYEGAVDNLFSRECIDTSFQLPIFDKYNISQTKEIATSDKSAQIVAVLEGGSYITKRKKMDQNTQSVLNIMMKQDSLRSSPLNHNIQHAASVLECDAYTPVYEYQHASHEPMNMSLLKNMFLEDCYSKKNFEESFRISSTDVDQSSSCDECNKIYRQNREVNSDECSCCSSCEVCIEEQLEDFERGVTKIAESIEQNKINSKMIYVKTASSENIKLPNSKWKMAFESKKDKNLKTLSIKADFSKHNLNLIKFAQSRNKRHFLQKWILDQMSLKLVKRARNNVRLRR